MGNCIVTAYREGSKLSFSTRLFSFLCSEAFLLLFKNSKNVSTCSTVERFSAKFILRVHISSKGHHACPLCNVFFIFNFNFNYFILRVTAHCFELIWTSAADSLKRHYLLHRRFTLGHHQVEDWHCTNVVHLREGECIII